MSAAPPGSDEGQALAPFLSKEVVLDTRGPLVYLGTLAAVDPFFFTLADVDVHDMQDGRTPKEKYILDARKFGVKKNRARVVVRREEVISFSLLEDVIDY